MEKAKIMEINEIRKQFINTFGLPRDGFHEPIEFIDTKIGFSVYKDRNEPDFKSLFRVYIKNEELEKQNPLKKLIITVSYGKKTEEGLVVSSSKFKKTKRWPLELFSEGEFFYNIRDNKFFNKKDEVQAFNILLFLDNEHIKSSKTFRGFWLRIKLFWFQDILANFFKFTFFVISWVLHLSSGKKYTLFDSLTEPNDKRGLKWEPPKYSKDDLINIFGYKVPPTIAFIYAFIHLFSYLLFYSYEFKPVWATTIFGNNFLTVMYIIVSLGLTNAVLPKLLKHPTNVLYSFLILFQEYYIKNLGRKVKI